MIPSTHRTIRLRKQPAVPMDSGVIAASKPLIQSIYRFQREDGRGSFIRAHSFERPIFDVLYLMMAKKSTQTKSPFVRVRELFGAIRA